MRRIPLALVVLLLAATPAFGDDVTKKHQVDAQITSLQGKLSAHKQQEQALRNQVAGYTSQIRTLESKAGDVSLKLSTLEADLALHQKRLDALNSLFRLQSKRFAFLEAEYAESMRTLNRRLVDIYESDQASTLDVFLGAANVQEALDQVAFMTDIGVQDRRIATEVSHAKAQVKAARAKTKKVRATVQSEAKVITARTEQTRLVRERAARRARPDREHEAAEAHRPLAALGLRARRGGGDRLAAGLERGADRAHPGGAGAALE